MKAFHISTALFAALIFVIVLIPGVESFRWSALILPLAVYVLLLVYGASQISSQFFLPALCKGDPDSKTVALSFDDGPAGQRSEEILKILEKYGCKASFFLTGQKAEARPDILKEMLKQGHLIGNHSYSHSNFFPLFRHGRIRQELEHTNRILKEAGAGQVRFFRPPFGVTNPNVARGLRSTGMEAAGWSIRSFDTRNEPAVKVAGRILKRMKGGDVILLHETSKNIIEILELLLPAISEAGLSCVTLDQLFGEAQSMKDSSRD